MTALSAQTIEQIVGREATVHIGDDNQSIGLLFSQIQPASIDLTIGKIEAISGAEESGVQLPHGTERKLGILERIFPKYRRPRFFPEYRQVFDNTFLVTFAETVNMPLDKVAIFIPRSSLMRMGVYGSVGLFDPGYSGKGQCLLHAFGRTPLQLEEGAAVGQLLFLNLDYATTKKYEGIFQNEGESTVTETTYIAVGANNAMLEVMGIEAENKIREATAEWVVKVPQMLAGLIINEEGRAKLGELPDVEFPADLVTVNGNIIATGRIGYKNWHAQDLKLGISLPRAVITEEGSKLSYQEGRDQIFNEILKEEGKGLIPNYGQVHVIDSSEEDGNDLPEDYESVNEKTIQLVARQADEDERWDSLSDMIEAIRSGNWNLIDKEIAERIISDARGKYRDFIKEAKELEND